MINGKVKTEGDAQSILDYASVLTSRFATNLETFIGNDARALVVTVAIPIIDSQPELRGAIVNANSNVETAIKALSAAIEMLQNPSRVQHKEVKPNA